MQVYSQALGMSSVENGGGVTTESYCEKLKNAMVGMGLGESFGLGPGPSSMVINLIVSHEQEPCF